MKISKIYSGEYLCCLPPELYRSIIDAVELAISKLYLSDSDKKEALYNANCEKLYNLTDTINIVFIQLIAIQINKGILAGSIPAISFIYKAFQVLYYQFNVFNLQVLLYGFTAVYIALRPRVR